MRVVHKHRIDRMHMHATAICVKPVDFGVDPKGDLCVWTEQGRDEKVWSLVVYGTGHEILPDYEHIASNRDGDFIWHLYGRQVA